MSFRTRHNTEVYWTEIIKTNSVPSKGLVGTCSSNLTNHNTAYLIPVTVLKPNASSHLVTEFKRVSRWPLWWMWISQSQTCEVCTKKEVAVLNKTIKFAFPMLAHNLIIIPLHEYGGLLYSIIFCMLNHFC